MRRLLPAAGLLSLAVVGVLAGSVLSGAVLTRHPKGYPTIVPTLERAAVGCGAERAAVKHLTDGFVVPRQPTVMTPGQLVSLAAPAVSQNSPRFTSVPAGSMPETVLVELKDVHVIAVKQEADSDLHVIIATSTGAELNVEAPQASCVSASPYAGALASARAAMDAAMPNVSSSSYTPLNLTATIEGMVFWDVLHGQRGAPNGIELHPVTFFSVGGSGPPTPPPPPTTTVLPPPVTTGAVTTVPLPDPSGCRRWPRRHWFHHVRHRGCRPNWFTSP